jgi:hypothetical protein
MNSVSSTVLTKMPKTACLVNASTRTSAGGEGPSYRLPSAEVIRTEHLHGRNGVRFSRRSADQRDVRVSIISQSLIPVLH